MEWFVGAGVAPCPPSKLTRAELAGFRLSAKPGGQTSQVSLRGPRTLWGTLGEREELGLRPDRLDMILKLAFG